MRPWCSALTFRAVEAHGTRANSECHETLREGTAGLCPPLQPARIGGWILRGPKHLPG